MPTPFDLTAPPTDRGIGERLYSWLSDLTQRLVESCSVQVLTFAAALEIDASTANVFKLTLTADVTSSTIVNGKEGQDVTLLLVQDAVGGRTFAWPTDVKLAGGSIALTAAGTKADIVKLISDGSQWWETGRSQNL